jgi:transposase-like protein
MENVSFLSVLQWTDQQCREYLERMRWPDGPKCPKCGEGEPYTITRKSESKNTVQSLYKCRACKRQFTATIGTIFEDSKIPLNKWFAAIYLMCSSKKGISAHQLHRSLDITYKSAWFMAHRVREAARDKGMLTPLTGTVEADETYVGGRTPRGGRAWREQMQDEINMGIRSVKPDWRKDKAIVFGMQERGGKARTTVVEDTRGGTLRPILLQNIDLKHSTLMTDGHPSYRQIKVYLPHEVIDHEIEYVRGDVHTQNIENYWSIFKRGVYGVFHHVSEDYLPCYLSEFDFRRNHREISDAERFEALMGQTQGRLLWYCKTLQPENPYA